MTTYEGKLSGKGMKFAIVVGRFNELISSRLYEGALDCLRRHDVADGDVDAAWVPGAFEMPLVAQRLAASGKYDAVICLGAVIRGGTPHFDYVAAEAAKGIAKVRLDTGVPVIFGVLTTDTIEQAVERAGTKAGNKGWAAASTALEMANLVRTLPDGLRAGDAARSRRSPAERSLNAGTPPRAGSGELTPVAAPRCGDRGARRRSEALVTRPDLRQRVHT